MIADGAKYPSLTYNLLSIALTALTERGQPLRCAIFVLSIP